MNGEIGVFEKAVAKAEELGKFAQEAAEESIRASQAAIRRAEEISKSAHSRRPKQRQKPLKKR